MIVIKKNGHRENWSDQKIKNAVLKSAERAKIILTDDELQNICINTTSIIKQTFPNKNEFKILDLILFICSGVFGISLAWKFSLSLYNPYTSAETPLLGTKESFF